MGNKQSSSKDGVKKRPKKGGKNERPRSVPGPIDELDPGLPKRPASVDMGSLPQAAQVSFHPDRNVAVSESPEETTLNLYKRSLHQIITVWPEMSPLSEVKPKKISPETLSALQKLYDSAYRKNQQVESLSKEKKKGDDYISTLQIRGERQVAELRKKDNEISDLDHQVCLLEGQLRKRGIAPKTQVPDEPLSDYDTLPFEESDRDMKRENKKRLSMMHPTPFLQAGGPRGQDAAIKRSNSMLTDGIRSRVTYKSTDTSILIEEQNQKIRSLQLHLDSKQKEINDLRERLGDGFDPSSSLSKLAPSAGPTIRSLVDIYGDLEEQALSNITEALTDKLADKTTEALHQFFCFTMETAYLQASGLMKAFIDTIHSLLINPLNSEVPTLPEAEARRNSRSHGNIDKHMFEKGPDLNAMSRLARRTRLTTDLPKYLEEEVASFIRVTSDSTNIEVLVGEVEDVLRRKFPSYATVTVLQDAVFADFLNRCCRLSWQLCSMSPPCNVTIDEMKMRYDEHYHDVLPAQRSSKPTIGAEIDYFVWPMMRRKKNGEVLYRARVALTQGKAQKF